MRSLICLAIALLLFSSSYAADSYPPLKKADGTRWRIGYLESGEYIDYQIIFRKIILSLMDKGWIEKREIPDTYMKKHNNFWLWCTKNLKSDYVEFVDDAFYTSEFQEDKRAANKAKLKKRIKISNDLDLIIAMGTWAGQDMADKDMNVPTIVVSSSDPLKSKIVKSADDSGYDHLHAKLEPDRYKKQIDVFFNLIGFKTLGFIMEDSLEGRTFSAYDDIIEMAEKYGFKTEICEAKFSDLSQAEAEENAIRCYRKLVKNVDAIYVTVHVGVSGKSIGRIVNIINKAKIPSFSQRGENEVEAGILMSISQAGFSYMADFHAEVITRIFNGEKPRDIPMQWTAPAQIALNIESAYLINWDPPFEILNAADRLYDSIKK